MAKLTLTFNDNVIAEHELDKEEVTIGRKPENDIQIDNLAVSGKHARILTILNDSFLEDTNSTNGTYVNGTLVKKHALQNGDVIAIGKHKLTYCNEEASAGGDFEKTMIIRPDAKGMPENEGDASVDQSVGEIGKKLLAEAEEQSEAAESRKARLRVVSGTNKGKELQLSKALTTIGKPGVQVAAVTRRSKGFFLIQIEAKDGGHPTVNGEPVGTEAVPLANEAVIEVAGVKMEFLLD